MQGHKPFHVDRYDRSQGQPEIVIIHTIPTFPKAIASGVPCDHRRTAVNNSLCQKAFLTIYPQQMYILMYITGDYFMKTITVTDFRKKASGFITEAEIIPFSGGPQQTPVRKKPGIHLQMHGSDLSSAILEERETK